MTNFVFNIKNHYLRVAIAELVDEAMKAAGTTNFYELTDEERAAWVEALAPVHEEMADRIGAETIAAVKAAVGQ